MQPQRTCVDALCVDANPTATADETIRRLDTARQGADSPGPTGRRDR